jgi:hypothetical protein
MLALIVSALLVGTVCGQAANPPPLPLGFEMCKDTFSVCSSDGVIYCEDTGTWPACNITHECATQIHENNLHRGASIYNACGADGTPYNASDYLTVTYLQCVGAGNKWSMCVDPDNYVNAVYCNNMGGCDALYDCSSNFSGLYADACPLLMTTHSPTSVPTSSPTRSCASIAEEDNITTCLASAHCGWQAGATPPCTECASLTTTCTDHDMCTNQSGCTRMSPDSSACYTLGLSQADCTSTTDITYHACYWDINAGSCKPCEVYDNNQVGCDGYTGKRCTSHNTHCLGLPSHNAPTTITPTTHGPVTHAPVSYAPTTLGPTPSGFGGTTTYGPTTIAPTTIRPTSHAPVTHAPTEQAGSKTPPPPDAKAKLTTGAIVGIVIGSVIGLVMLWVGVAYYMATRGGGDTDVDDQPSRARLLAATAM